MIILKKKKKKISFKEVRESETGAKFLIQFNMGLLKTEKNNISIDGKNIEKNIYNWQQNIDFYSGYLMDSFLE